MIRPDLKLHLAFGLAAVVGSLGVVALALLVGVGAAVAAAGVAVGVGYEVVQKLRNDGTPDPLDAIVTAAPGILTGIVLTALGI